MKCCFFLEITCEECEQLQTLDFTNRGDLILYITENGSQKLERDVSPALDDSLQVLRMEKNQRYVFKYCKCLLI